VAYSLEFHKDRVLPYLRHSMGLSRGARVRLFTFLNQELRENADSYIQDAARRLAPGSDCFSFDLVLRDREGDGGVHRILFIVSAATAKYGVLRIEYVEEWGRGSGPAGRAGNAP
jgi:hypothetical protein